MPDIIDAFLAEQPEIGWCVQHDSRCRLPGPGALAEPRCILAELRVERFPAAAVAVCRIVPARIVIAPSGGGEESVDARLPCP